MLYEIDRFARSLDGRVKNVFVSLGSEHKVILVASSDGRVVGNRDVGGRDVSTVHPPADTAEGDEPDEIDEERTVVYQVGKTLKDMEEEAITAALKEVGGNRREAAEMLGIGARTLYRKIKEYEIPL